MLQRGHSGDGCKFSSTLYKYDLRKGVTNKAPITQSVSALDFNFERAVEGSIITAGKRLSLKILMY